MIEVITPSSNYYDDARQEWNKSIDKYPTAIAYCKTFDDVKKAVLFARKNRCRQPLEKCIENHAEKPIPTKDRSLFSLHGSHIAHSSLN